MTKGRQEHSFYSLPEFERWKAETEHEHTWKVKYYKGLGTSTSKEAKVYFSDMDRHRIPFRYQGHEDDEAILLVSIFVCSCVWGELVVRRCVVVDVCWLYEGVYVQDAVTLTIFLYRHSVRSVWINVRNG